MIVAVGAGITVAARGVFGAVVNPDSAYETAGGTIGTVLSAGFLYLIAALNLVVLAGIVKVFRDMRGGAYDERELEAQLQARGLMYRFFGRFMRSINHTWQLYFVGVIFGIGFDTATEVVLLAATAYAALQGLPYYAVLALPLLFAGGLMLLDTIDGCFMTVAYGWAFAKPVRKVYYNLIITGLSIGRGVHRRHDRDPRRTDAVHLHGFWSRGFNRPVLHRRDVRARGAAALVYWRLGHVGPGAVRCPAATRRPGRGRAFPARATSRRRRRDEAPGPAAAVTRLTGPPGTATLRPHRGDRLASRGSPARRVASRRRSPPLRPQYRP